MYDIKLIDKKVKEVLSLVLDAKRYFHMNPELGFEEYKTSQYIYDALKSFKGIDEVDKVAQTGVLAVIKTGREGKTVAFRADIDALPIKELNEGEYISKVDGVMHACGHDGHAAMLLGAAKILSEIKDTLCGEIRLLFQPSEEKAPGGAKAMIEEGVLDGVDYIFGAHLDALTPPGSLGIKPGSIMANSGSFKAKIIGDGGHAAFPHQSIDTVYTASQIVTALQGIIPRNINAFNRAVLTTTIFKGSDANNIIPKTVEIGGTIRILDPECEDTLKSRIEDVIGGICKMNGASYELELDMGYPILYNDIELSNKIKEIFTDITWEDNVYEDSAVMGGEDFARYLQCVRGCFYKVGGRKEKPDGKVYPHHNSKFEINDSAYENGVRSCVAIISSALNDFK
ncbi:MAG: amidohydrolase [Maledivibacter sp.]|jgi:amidohydrolase|nr:amidohydrolase [Maledivibacter sp.]